MMEERGLVGLEARAVDGGEVIGRISEVITDEDTGEVTHVIVETDDERVEERFEVPIAALDLDPEADFATFHADPSDEEPGDHVGDTQRPEGFAPGRVSWRGADDPDHADPDHIEPYRTDDAEAPEGYAPSRPVGPEDWPHEGQFVAAPEDESMVQSPEELDRQADEAGGWEDESSTPFDSGYPRNDAYIDPDTGQERERYPAEGEDLRGDVEQLLDGTELRLREVREGVIVLEGSMSRQEDLEEVLADINDVEGVLDVDTTDVNIGT